MMNATEAVIAVMIAFTMGATFVGMARPTAIECMQATKPAITQSKDGDK